MVSHYLRDVVRNVRSASPDASDELEKKVRIIGLPIDLEHIDSAHQARDTHRTTIVFNHAPIASKQPDLFLDVAEGVLTHTDAHFLLTRHFSDGSPALLT